MDYLISFHMGWLIGAFLLGFAFGWIAVVHRARGVSKMMASWIAAVVAALIGVAIAKLVPGRFGYWLDLGLMLFGCYLAGCAIGSWLRERVVSRAAKPTG